MIARSGTIAKSFAFRFYYIGMIVLLCEGLFFQAASRLSDAPYWIPSVLPINLMPSEIWFILVANVLMLSTYFLRGKARGHWLSACATPLYTIALIYFFWTLFGIGEGFESSLQDFRSMAFGALCLPPLLVLSTRASFISVIKKYYDVAVFFAPVYSILAIGSRNFGLYDANSSIFATHWIFPYLLILPFFISISAWTSTGSVKHFFHSLVFSFAIVAPMDKPAFGMYIIAVFLFFLVGSIFRILSLKRIAMAMLGAIGLLTILSAAVLVLDSSSGGAIERHVRTHYFKEGSATGDISGGRFRMWGDSIDSWSMKPLLGWGVGKREDSYYEIDNSVISNLPAHNIVIQTLVQTGLVGLIIVVSSWLTWYVRAISYLRKVGRHPDFAIMFSMLLSVLTILGSSLYGVPTAASGVSLSLWIFAGFFCLKSDDS